MPEVESHLSSVKSEGLTSLPALVDLNGIDASKRAAAWQGGAQACFPGLSVGDLHRRPEAGTLVGGRFGLGHLWSILSPSLQVSYDPTEAPLERTQMFSLMVQLRGCMRARQDGRTAVLRPGALSVMDGARPFDLSVEGKFSHFVVLQMPRRAVLGRNPSLERCTAEALDPLDGGTLLLRNLLVNILDNMATLRDEQRGAALAAIIQLVGALQSDREAVVGWRVRAALAFIDSSLADPELTATRVADAQGVSRRRLDQIMVGETGVPLSSQIWLRRLEQAASDLRDSEQAERTVTQIAFATGFESAAHFTRAFKRRFKVLPRDWRHMTAAATVGQRANPLAQ
jgi:AraC family transcriptional activator of tynA and feaB